MSLITPILEKHGAFDVNYSTDFIVTIGKGGEKPTRIYLYIKNNVTGQTVASVYWDLTASYYENNKDAKKGKYNLTFSHPSTYLSNGTYYTAYVQTYNTTSGYSNKSNSIQFLCLANPTLTRSGYAEGDTIDSPSATFTTIYNQANGDPINSITHKLINTVTDEILNEKTEYSTYTTVPYTINYIVNGLLSNNSYRYEISVITVSGLSVNIETNFDVEYETPSYTNAMVLSNLCDYGVIKIESKFKSINGTNRNGTYAIDGEDSYIHIPKSLNPIQYEGKSNEPQAYWSSDSLTDILCNQNDMTIMCWFRPEGINSDTWDNLYFQSGIRDDGSGCKYAHKFNFKRGLVPNTNTYADYIEYVVYDAVNQTYIGKYRSNYVTDIGTSDDKYYIYFNRNNTTIDLRLSKLTDNGDSVWGLTTQSTTTGNLTAHMKWNLLNNYMQTTNSYHQSSFTPSIQALPDENIIHMVSLRNGNYYNLTIYNGYADYNETEPTEFTDNMIFNCAFNGNLSAGDLEAGEDVDTFFVKKRVVGTNVWLPIYNVKKTTSAFDFTIYDPYCANNTEYEYALVPCKTTVNGYIEGTYAVKTVVSKFDGCLIADNTNFFKGMVNINYDATDTREYGMLQPLNKKYPIIINNGSTRYNKGTLDCAVMGYKYMQTRKLNVSDISSERNDLVDFLNNDNIKVVKNWTGDVVVVSKVGDVTRTINSQTGYSSIGFSWVEQGHINDLNLYENKILQAIDTVPDFITKANAPEVHYDAKCDCSTSGGDGNYVTEDELNRILNDYVTNINLNTTLGSYQTRALTNPLIVNGSAKQTVETSLNGLNNTFQGTRAQWNALPQSTKNLYSIVIITDE